MKLTQLKNPELSEKDIKAIKMAEEQIKRGEYIPFEEVFQKIRNLYPET